MKRSGTRQGAKGAARKSAAKKRTRKDVGACPGARRAAGAADVRYRILLESLDAAVLLMHGAECVECNPATLALFGLSSKDEILGKTPLDFAPPRQPDGRDSAEMVRENIEQALQKGLHVFEWQAFRKGGEPVFLEVRFTPYRIGQDQYFQCVAIDITVRKRAERELAEREAMLRQIMDTASVAIFLVDKAGRITQANKRMAEMFGCTMDELVGSEYVAHVHPSERETGRAKMLALLASTIPSVDLERHYWRKDGTEFWGHLTGKRFYDVRGDELGLIGVISDITERKQAELALKKSEKMLQTIIDAEPECVKVLDENANLVMMNRAGLDMLEVESLDQVKGQCVCPLVMSDYRPAFMDLTRRVFQGEAGTLLFEMVGVKGRRLWLETHAVPLRNEKDEITALLGLTRDVTERKRAEEELREKERTYRTLFESANDGIFIYDRTGIRDCNQRGAEMYGRTKEQVIGRSPAEFAPERQPDGRMSADVVDERVQAAMSGAPQIFEWQSLRADGAPFDVEITLSRLELGGEMCLQAIVRDITERKRAEAETRRNEARMSSLYRISQHPAENEQSFLDLALNEAISLTGSAIGYLYAYDEMKREFTLNAYSRDVMKECSVAEKKTCYELDRTGIWGEAVRQRKPILLNEFGSDHPLKRGYPEGHAVLRKFLTVPVIMQGAVVAVVGVANKPVDYTDADVLQLDLLMDSVWKMVQRARAERALQMSEERFRDLAESLPLTVFEMDLQGRFTYVNWAALEKFGYSQQEFDAGLNMAQMLAPGDRDRAREIMASRLTGNTDGYREYQGLRRDGTTFPITVASGPILRDGRPVGLRGIVSDLSERKQLEEEQLKAQKLESIGTLAGGIAHDFNNLLQGIFGYISMAKLSLGDKDKTLVMLTQAERALHQSVSLASQLLTFSKGGKPVKKLLSLQPVIERACTFSLSGSRTDCRIRADDGLWCVEADEGQIGQVVQNIVLNADQAMPAGGTIGLAASNVSAGSAALPQGLEPGNYVSLSISDSGVGIPAEYLSRIFDPYFTTKEKGSGLGLATSYSIIRNHGGMITVRSEPGAGSTFTVYLPASPDRVAKVQDRASPAPGRAGRVLVMDDDDVVRTVAGELLLSLGHEVELAVHGEEAIEKYRQAMAAGRPFDVVILDLTIRGGMGGAETVKKLLELDPAVKAVVSSGYSDDAVTSNYREHGFRSYLSKPYTVAGLNDMLSKLMS